MNVKLYERCVRGMNEKLYERCVREMNEKLYERYVKGINEKLYERCVRGMNENKRPVGHIAHLRKQLKSINTYDYIITLIKRRKKPLLSL